MNMTRQDFQVESLGAVRHPSPLLGQIHLFAGDGDRVLYPRHPSDVQWDVADGLKIPSFEMAGPRKKIFFDPASTVCGIVTCGGLCPGINDVIRAIVHESYGRYGIKQVYGFRFGYRGMVRENSIPPVLLDTEMVDDIHEKGGSVLASSRGPQDVKKIVDYLQELNISILYTIGGDGTLHGAMSICEEIRNRKAEIAVIGIPKTIDNDVSFVDKTFGFETAVEESMSILRSAHIEAKGTDNGIGLVKLMGRDSGFIAAQATLANTDVNYCLIPEVPFDLDGEGGLLAMLEQRLKRRHHAVIVVAEGAGQEHMERQRGKDPSGNTLYEDIGIFLKSRIQEFLKHRKLPFSIKYFDPSYIIRSKPANANDSQFCLQLGQHAVHAGMAGMTQMLVGYWSQHYTHVPIRLAVADRKKVSLESGLWQAVVAVTEHGRRDQGDGHPAEAS